MKKEKISKTYIELIKLLDDDDIFISCFNLMPMKILEPYVPKSYLIERYKELKENGKLKDWRKKNDK